MIVSFLFISDNEYIFSNPNTAIRNDPIIDSSSIVLIRFNGFDMRYICINPACAISNIPRVDMSLFDSTNLFDSASTRMILNIIVKAVGNDLLITFVINFPLVISSLGSSARMSDGIPIVKTLVKVS